MQQEFRATLTEHHMKTHIPHAFEVSPGTTRLTIDLTFAPARVEGFKNMLCLTLIGPDGFRGAGHRSGNTHHVEVGLGDVTPGYLAGPLPPGRWEAIIDTHMVMPGVPVDYLLRVATTAEPQSVEAAPSAPQYALQSPRGQGWYRGDLHAHTTHSDASWGVPDLLAAARTRGLDFVTITDHNTISHLVGLEALSDERLLVMGGTELTTFWGHALSLGTRGWVDWRVGPNRTMPQIAREVAAGGGLFVIAHPCTQGDPYCTGCDWRYVEMEPGPAPAVEIWNGLWSEENERGLALYYTWLNDGYRLVATSGTDAHGPAPADARPGFDVVYAEERTEAAILAAVARGHLYVSSGPRLELHGRAADGTTAMMGDLLPAGAAGLAIIWADVPVGSSVRLVADGQALHEVVVAEAGDLEWEVSAGTRWCAAELRAADGEVRAVTNPIFFGEWGR
jgi:hypothetical protein